MSAVPLPARAGRDSTPPPLPWSRMVWITWRQHRLVLAGVVALLAVAGAYLLITGLPMHAAYGAVTACRPSGSAACQQVAADFLGAYAPGVGVTLGLLQVIPALIGAFAGAPLLGREFESGTFRYAWTQGFGRTRWTVAKLVPLAVALTVAAGAFSAIVAWYWAPITGAGDTNGPLYPTIFDLLGVALAAWTLTAFAIGVVAGVLIRRVIPAMVATIAVWAALAFATGWFLRPHYRAPLITRSASDPAGGWVISQGWFKGGYPASLDMLQHTLGRIDVQAVTPEVFSPGPLTPANLDPVQYLIHNGFTQLTTYEPAAWFWQFQSIEGAWLLALSLILVTAAVWLVRRRAA